ncbi:MAG: hypothetical protein GY710_11975 [Desulfobacteraceae bacterium]|nr:hypothetical protein [Desulfobacteraceae bacterium]
MINEQGVILDKNKEDIPITRAQNIFDCLNRIDRICLRHAMRNAPDIPSKAIQIKPTHQGRIVYCTCWVHRYGEHYLINGWKIRGEPPDLLSKYQTIAF